MPVSEIANRQNPRVGHVRPTICPHGAIAQLVERPVCIREAAGSNPAGSIIKPQLVRPVTRARAVPREGASAVPAGGSAASMGKRGTTPSSRPDPAKRDDERMDWKLELITVPVSDVDRAKAFYTEQVGFNADHDHTVSDQIRFVQLTPPGSACSIAIGKGLTQMAPGSLQNIQVVVSDIDAARAELLERGVEASEVQDLPGGRFVFFSDPDGNGWVVQLPSGA